MSSLTAYAMDRLSKVDVPRPISSSNTKELRRTSEDVSDFDHPS